jgi:hypothetical protein
VSHATVPLPPDAPRLAGEARRLVELFGVCSLAIARPVYDGFGAEPSQFLLRDANRLVIVAFALLVAIGPPIVVWGAGYVVGFGSRSLRVWAHWTSIGALLGLLVVELTGIGQQVTGWALVAGLVVVGMPVGRILSGRPNVGLWLRYVGVAAPVFCLQFLLLSAVSGLVLPRGGAASAAAAAGPVPATDHVVMVVLDELPTASLLDAQDRIDSVRFPNFARLTQRSTFYRNHTTVADSTLRALPALLTGIKPEPGSAAPATVDFPDNLFSMLEPTHDIEAIESVSGMCPDSVCEVTADQGTALRILIDDAIEFFGRRLRRERQNFMVTPSEEAAGEQVDTLVSSLPSFGDPPSFRFLHALVPHQPWETSADGRQYQAPALDHQVLDDEEQWPDAYTAWGFRVRHLQKLEYTDKLLGQILDGLDERGVWDDTLLVVVADHGIGFSVGQRPRFVSPGNEPEVLWTPLWVKVPDQGAGRIRDDPVESVDVVPMIGAGLGIDVPYAVDGTVPGDGGDDADPDRAYESFGRTSEVAEEHYQAMLELPPPSADDGDLGVWRGGPELTRTVGEPMAELAAQLVAPDTWKVDLFGRQRFEAVDPDAESLPLLIHGAVRWGGRSGARHESERDIAAGDLAVVAVNGSVAGWSALAPAGGDDLRWSVFISPSLLIEGENSIDVGIVPAGTALEALRSGTVEIALLPLD